MSTNKVWAGILSGVKSQVSASIFKTWFANSDLLEHKLSGGKNIFVVSTKNSFLKQQLETRYMPLVLESAKKAGFANCEFVFVVSKTDGRGQLHREPLFSGVPPTYIASYKKSDSLSPNHTFENFVVGGSNNLAYLAFTQTADNVGVLYNPLFVYGQTGVGKTHLLQAFGNHVLAKVMDAKVLYVSAEKFTNDFIDSLNNRSTQAFRQKYRSVDVLLVDDVQFFSGKESTQDEFFHTFNELHLSGRQLVLASDKHPRELGRIKERLSSRFLGGMTVDIGRADLELRSAILKSRCREKGVELSDEIVGYIASTCESGARELEGVLVQVLAMTKLSGGKVDLLEIKRTLSTPLQTLKPAVTPGKIIESVSRHFKIKAEDLCGPRRVASLVYPRQVLMFLLRHDLGLPFGAIGQLLGGRDHSTILYGAEKIEAMLPKDQSKRDEVSRIRANF